MGEDHFIAQWQYRKNIFRVRLRWRGARRAYLSVFRQRSFSFLNIQALSQGVRGHFLLCWRSFLPHKKGLRQFALAPF